MFFVYCTLQFVNSVPKICYKTCFWTIFIYKHAIQHKNI